MLSEAGLLVYNIVLIGGHVMNVVTAHWYVHVGFHFIVGDAGGIMMLGSQLNDEICELAERRFDMRYLVLSRR